MNKSHPKAASEKYVYDFSEGGTSMKLLLGSKGANLAEMTNLGIPVPFGFTITTEACAAFYKNNRAYPEGVLAQIEEKINVVENHMGCTFGDPKNPLLLSVRSGAAVSMPGMMDTVLNLGLNENVVEGLIAKTQNDRFVWDSYRRFLQMFGNVVMGVSGHHFETILTLFKNQQRVNFDTDLSARMLRDLTYEFKSIIKEKTGKAVPDEPREQLQMAIDAVFDSWNNPRAVLYRKLNDIKGLHGTAVNVQAMVFGNMGETSGTGVCFTRNPSTGENIFYGEYLMNAQGEDVVAGTRTPLTLATLHQNQPALYDKLDGIRHTLEQHYTDMQDIEFTIQKGQLYVLQTRTGKRTAAAAVRCALEMVDEGLIDKATAINRVSASSLDQLLHKQIDPMAKKQFRVLATGLAASPGAATGMVVFDAVRAHDLAEEGQKVILVRTETSPEDLMGMNASQGILTSRGGMTSHAAVVARGMGKCCVAGCSDVHVHEEEGYFAVNDKHVNEGDYITLDGSTGEVFAGQMPTVNPTLTGHFDTLMHWADEFRRLKIRANADTPHDAEQAVVFGAEGIGLCRTEHMFFAEDRILAMREMILATDTAGRKNALNKLLPYQKTDFIGIFKAMEQRPVTIRLLDPPLHEFLPKAPEDIAELARILKVSKARVNDIIEKLEEQNPMLGHRGCRLGITYPEITEMQTRAIIEAALECGVENICPEIMIPLVGSLEEFRNQRDVVVKTAEDIISASGKKLRYLVGTMIEVPRATLIADQIALEADFFSFGTNDLTQMTFGFSRDDMASFVPDYLRKGILAKDPFQEIDREGVGQLVRLTVKNGRAANAHLHLGICGEHGGDPTSVEFFDEVGLDYVSCSPYRVPIARLAAAQAALKHEALLAAV
jgi:pyruvate,orthophosphate dikinase